MPIVRIDIESGKSTAYKRAVLHGVRSAITGAIGADDERVMSRLVETSGENIDVHASRSDSLTIIEISMLPGRGPDIKSRLYEAIVSNLSQDPGIHARDIMVLINDPSAECFAIGGVMQCNLAPTQAADEDDED